MTDEQRDPAAELRAQAEALAEGFRPLLEFTKTAVDAFSRAAEAWLEQQRPFFEWIKAIAADPAVRDAVMAKQIAQIAEYRACHCLCGKMHPDDKGICDAFNPVTTRRLGTTLLGPVDIPLCAPCAAAQFLAEVTGHDH